MIAYWSGRHLRKWRPRWVVLEGSTLHTFKKEKDYANPTEIIDLKVFSSVKSSEDHTHKPFSFDVYSPESRFSFVAKSENDKEDWIRHIGKAIVLSNTKVRSQYIMPSLYLSISQYQYPLISPQNRTLTLWMDVIGMSLHRVSIKKRLNGIKATMTRKMRKRRNNDDQCCPISPIKRPPTNQFIFRVYIIWCSLSFCCHHSASYKFSVQCGGYTEWTRFRVIVYLIVLHRISCWNKYAVIYIRSGFCNLYGTNRLPIIAIHWPSYRFSDWLRV